jgi:class 3 adenylate cyclase
MRSIVVSGSVDVASSPEDVWTFVSDTDRTNRLIGHEVLYRPIDPASSATGARFVAETRTGGFKLTYDELPFEWTHGKSFKVERRMRGGLLESYTLAWSLTPSRTIERGTRVDVTLELLPRYAVVRPVVWFQARGFVRRLTALAEAIDAHVRDNAPSPYRQPVSAADAHLVTNGIAALKKAGVREPLAERIGAHLREAPDADLVRVRPFELADAWACDRRELLGAMLHAVPAGLFDLRWAIVCPSCRTASDQTSALDEIAEEGHCQLCDISFELELDRAVEATFVPHAGVRRVPNQMFCIGGPARTPHVLAQVNVEPGSMRALEAPPESGRYRIFARGGAVASVEVDESGPAEARVSIGDDALRPADARVAPSGRVLVANATGEARHVKLERLGYASDAATAHLLSTVGEFRRLFSRDLIKRGTPLKVARVAILFSDLTGSTALYSQVGDAAAFRLVDDHFDVIKAAIERHEGAVVKTMGDAVMAAFLDPRQCIRASIEALRIFEAFRAGREHGALVGIKLGMFDGPCYVVTANGHLDYFGQTVNVASRVQHLAASGELVVPRETYDALGDDERRLVDRAERFEARVKGVDAPLDLLRLRLAAVTSDASEAPRTGT